ncbi:hypothetical protein FVE85_2850 [Porphyridium purpureum]|uniref:Biogenesis factor required for ATP synthase 1-like C-terminal domain-containing protein n=1 Tax=Porphyridium purpureum TaxID=35688 RepID=A0A5J4YT15_PORPP|nr:hypothetical protein FVE85_2850 [Porphyridium purpureum]|eukprot:POR3073..scf227_4
MAFACGLPGVGAWGAGASRQIQRTRWDGRGAHSPDLCRGFRLSSPVVCMSMSDARRMGRSAGRWEGSLARYTPDGQFVSRQPTILFLEAEYPFSSGSTSNDDVDPVGISIALRRPAGGQRDALEYRTKSMLQNMRLSGTFCSDLGAYSNGTLQLSSMAPPVLEQGMNACTVDQNGASVPVEARVRGVIFYEFCGSGGFKLSGLSVFREKRSDPAKEEDMKAERMRVPQSSVVSPDVANADVNDVASTQTVAFRSLSEYFAALEGTWRGRSETFTSEAPAGAPPVVSEYTMQFDFDAASQTIRVRSDTPASFETVGTVSASNALTATFDRSTLSMVLLGESGVTSLQPAAFSIPSTAPLLFELCWFRTANERYRVSRTYRANGAWMSTFFSRETRV